MVAMTVQGFSGLAPRVHKRLLAPNQAQIATNCRLTNGQLAPLRDPFAIEDTNVAGALAVFRMVGGAGERWLAWNRDVDIVRGPIKADVLQRIYWTGDGEPRMSVYADATNGAGPFPDTFYVLGIFPPAAAASVSPPVGSDETRVYAYTFVSTFGEESGPSPASTGQTGAAVGTWALTGMSAAPANTFAVTAATWLAGIATLTVASTYGLRVGEEVTVSGMTPAGFNGAALELTDVTSTTIKYAVATNPGAYSAGGTITRDAPHNSTGMTKRIYRTVTAASGATEYRYVAEIAASATTYNDALPMTTVALNEALPTASYDMPPADMRGIVALANGIMAGFSKNQLCLSEPYQPHSWPSIYRQTSTHQIVGIGSFGTTIVVATEGSPYTVQGVEPGVMGGGMDSLNIEWPCLSKRGLVSTNFGVMFPVPQGLALIGIGGAEIVTRDYFTPEEWRAVAPETFVASMRDNKYYAGYTMASGDQFLLIIDRSEFASVTLANYDADELWADLLTGKLHIVKGGEIFEWDSTNSTLSTYDWLSKEFVLPNPVNFGAAKIDADFTMTVEETAAAAAAEALVVAANQVLINSGQVFGAYGILPLGMIPPGGNMLASPPSPTYDALQFLLYAEGVLRFVKQVTNSRPFRLPGGFKSDYHTFRLAGNVKVASIKIAETMEGLKSV